MPKSILRISFPGSGWGIAAVNDQRQSWRWLGPSGRSHVLIRLAPDSDYLVRVRVQTAAPGDVLSRLRVRVNGGLPVHQGIDWGADGVLHAWCFIERAMLAPGDGLVRLTLTIRPEDDPENDEAADGLPEPFAFARQIAFSRLSCEPYPEAASAAADELIPGEPAVSAVGHGAIDLAGSFFGSEWGVVGCNDRRQSWRWLGPSGRSHVLIRLAPDSDYLVRVRVQTAAPGDVLSRLRVRVNDRLPVHQGIDWGADGVLHAWCFIERAMLAPGDGLVRLTLTIRPKDDPENDEAADGSPEPFAFARQIAFSRFELRALPGGGQCRR